jgi:hypothetical protein
MRRFRRAVRRRRSRLAAATAAVVALTTFAAPGAVGADAPALTWPCHGSSPDPSCPYNYTGPQADVLKYNNSSPQWNSYTHLSTSQRPCALTWSDWYQFSDNNNTSFTFQEAGFPVELNHNRFRVCYGNYQGSIVVDSIDMGTIQWGNDYLNGGQSYAPHINAYFQQWTSHVQYIVNGSPGPNTSPDVPIFQGPDLTFEWNTADPNYAQKWEYLDQKPLNQQFGYTSAIVWVYNCPWYWDGIAYHAQDMQYYLNETTNPGQSTCGWAGQQISLK